MLAPLISICIPVYNAERTLKQTIESILRQTISNFELIIVNNCSTDHSLTVIDQFNDPRIQIINNPTTVDMADNWSKALSAAKGKWTKLVCADDILHMDALRLSLVAFDKYPDAAAVFGARNIINEDGLQLIRSQSQWRKQKLISRKDLINKILSSGTNPIGEPLCVMWKTNLNAHVMRSLSEWNYYVDLEMWLKISEHGDFVNIFDRIGSFRVTKGALTARRGFKVVAEARRFFLTNTQFSRCSIFRKAYALMIAFLKILGRKIFLHIRNA